MTTTMRPVAMNLVGQVEHPELSANPYAIDIDGHPFVPTGTSGIVLGVALGDRLDAVDADHVAPGVTIAHPLEGARHSLAALSCVGNDVVVRTGAAAGERGFVLGKRGEAGRVIVHFDQDVIAVMQPGDQVKVRAFGQGAPAPVPDVQLMNLDPALLDVLTTNDGAVIEVGVRTVFPSKVCGNGIGRPARAWDIDLSISDPAIMGRLRYGDLVAIDDIDARTNIGFRRGWRTVGVVVHGPSRLPGHGPGVVPLLTGPGEKLTAMAAADHEGITVPRLGLSALTRPTARRNDQP
jgi:hypothetical protein